MTKFFSLSIGVIFSLGVILLKLHSVEMSAASILAIVVIGYLVPIFFSRQIMTSASSFFDLTHSSGSAILSLHGVVFLLFIQATALLYVTESIFSQFFRDSHHLIMIGIVVASGIAAVTGNGSAIRKSNTIVGLLMIIGTVMLLVNTTILEQPVFLSFQSTLDGLRAQNSTSELESNGVVVITALSIAIFWIMWLEIGEWEHKKELTSHAQIRWMALISGAMVFAIDYAAHYQTARTMFEAADGIGVVDMVIIVCAVAMIFSLFVSTLYSIGVVGGYRIYPIISEHNAAEKKQLIQKLTTVFSVIIVILMIPVVRNSGVAAVTWYSKFLVVFTSPFVAAFVIFIITKQKHSHAIPVGILLGTMYLVAEMIAELLTGSEHVNDGSSMYLIALTGGMVTAVSYVLILKVGELVSVKKFFARMQNTRSSM